MSDTEVIIIRHAESTTNAGEITSDTANVPLSKKGERQRHAIPKIIPSQTPNSDVLMA